MCSIPRCAALLFAMTCFSSVPIARGNEPAAAGPNKGKTYLAIFEMKDADSMRVCYDLSGKEFPAEFKAPKDTQLYLAGYRRQKEKPKGN